MPKQIMPFEIEVDEPDYQTAFAPNELVARGGPCIFLGAIYENKGYLLHVSHYSSKDSEPMNLFEDLKKDVKNKKWLKIYLGGGGFDIDLDQEYILENRRLALEDIKKHGLESRIKRIRWCPSKSCQALRLILSNLTAQYEEFNPETGEGFIIKA